MTLMCKTESSAFHFTWLAEKCQQITAEQLPPLTFVGEMVWQVSPRRSCKERIFSIPAYDRDVKTTTKLCRGKEMKNLQLFFRKKTAHYLLWSFERKMLLSPEQ